MLILFDYTSKFKEATERTFFKLKKFFFLLLEFLQDLSLQMQIGFI